VARDPFSSEDAYFLALGWLTARDLSEGQVRERLARRGFTPGAVNPAIQRLLSERALDNRRAATAVARTEANVRHHGPRRIMGKLLAMQFDRDLAREVVQEFFGETDEAELLEQTLDKRLHGSAARLGEPQERRKLVAYLVRQGFSAASASGLIRKRSREK
jgi:SOS response regulatory protein OraA/RecX